MNKAGVRRYLHILLSELDTLQTMGYRANGMRCNIKYIGISVIGIAILIGCSEFVKKLFILFLNFRFLHFNFCFLALQFTVPPRQLLILLVDSAKRNNKLI